MTEAGNKLLRAARNAREIARGEADAANVLIPPDIDVREIRARLKLSQEAFAQSYGFTVHQIRDWEQARSRPLGALRAYLTVIREDPAFVRGVFESHKQNARQKSNTPETASG
jgi:putative transcriptional regulator